MLRQLVQFFPGDLVTAAPVNAPAPELPASPAVERNHRALLCMHPYLLSRLLERAWLEHELTTTGPVQNLALPQQLFWNLGSWAASLPGGVDRAPTLGLPAMALPTTPWDHLIYAYFIENTRAVDIFRRIVRELATGERLSIPNNLQAMSWARTTEELFFRDATAFPIGNLISQVRPDFNATRRNAYYRMFGMDLNHGMEDGRPYPYDKPEAANRDFVRLFEQLIVDVWAARVNRANVVGTNPTDPAAVARTVRLLEELLTMRKRNGTLQREEFVSVSMMSWFHLTLGGHLNIDTPIVEALSCTATTPGERLIRLGQRVGIPAHPRTREFIELANNMSVLLRLIETGVLSNASTVPLLWNAASPLSPLLDEIITSWSLVTGRDVKASTLRVSASPAQLPPPMVTTAVVAPGAALVRN